MAMVFQTFALFPSLTIQRNVELGLETQGVAQAERSRRALVAFDLIGLDGFESALPMERSGGTRQRVGCARWSPLSTFSLWMSRLAPLTG
jgi:NitT/TauT family transport system ATP-binding protein